MRGCTLEGEGEVAASGLLSQTGAPRMFSTTIQVETETASNVIKQCQSRAKPYSYLDYSAQDFVAELPFGFSLQRNNMRPKEKTTDEKKVSFIKLWIH